MPEDIPFRFWFIVVGGEDANVAIMDPRTVITYYWGVGEWVMELGILDWTIGPDRSLRDARPIDRAEAMAWLDANATDDGWPGSPGTMAGIMEPAELG